MKKSLLFLFAVLISVSTYSKAGFKIGAGAGLNVAKIKEKYYSDVNSKMLAFDVAIPMEIKVSKYFAIQPEIHFIQKGFSLNRYGIGGVNKEYRRRNFIEFPILFKFVYPIKDKHYLSFFTGAGVGYALSNKQILKMDDGSTQKNKLTFDTNVNDDNTAYNKIDAVVPIGFGYEYKINSKISIYTDLRWSLDVTNNIKYKVKPDPTPYYKYRNFIFSVGMFFIAKDK